MFIEILNKKNDCLFGNSYIDYTFEGAEIKTILNRWITQQYL